MQTAYLLDRQLTIYYREFVAYIDPKISRLTFEAHSREGSGQILCNSKMTFRGQKLAGEDAFVPRVGDCFEVKLFREPMVGEAAEKLFLKFRTWLQFEEPDVVGML